MAIKHLLRVSRVSFKLCGWEEFWVFFTLSLLWDLFQISNILANVFLYFILLKYIAYCFYLVNRIRCEHERSKRFITLWIKFKSFLGFGLILLSLQTLFDWTYLAHLRSIKFIQYLNIVCAFTISLSISKLEIINIGHLFDNWWTISRHVCLKCFFQYI